MFPLADEKLHVFYTKSVEIPKNLETVCLLRESLNIPNSFSESLNTTTIHINYLSRLDNTQ